MMKYFVPLLFAALATASSAQTLTSRPLTGPSNKDVAYTNQHILLDGSNATHVSVAPLTSSNSGFGVSKLATKVQGLPFGTMPIMAQSNPTTASVALEEASRWVKEDLPKFQSDYGDWLKSKGLSMGFYNYTHEIMISTEEFGLKKKAIAFNATFDINKRPTYGNAKIVDPDPTVVEAIYVPLKAAAGLPSTWKYPDAGKIKWRVLNKKYEPLTDWRMVDVNGAYDTPESAESSEPMAACLMDNRYPNCPSSVDIRSLMGKSGSIYGLVTYVRSLTPVYERGTPDSQVPLAAISVDKRTYDCKDYTNEGFYGFVLELIADQYTAELTAEKVRYQKVGEVGGRGISPTEPYIKKIPISNLNGANPEGVIINPTPEDDSLWSTSNTALMQNVLYVAPVEALGGNGVMDNASYAPDMAVSVISATDTSREYYVGTVGDNYWSHGVYDRSVQFNLDRPQTLESFKIDQVGFDDHMLVAVNGTLVYIGKYAGSMLELQSSGNAVDENCYPSGGGWTCKKEVFKGVHTGTGTTCPSGQRYVPFDPQLDTPAHCVEDIVNTYQYCEISSSYSGDTTMYECTQGCAPNHVQYLPGATGRGPGCHYVEQGTNFKYDVDLNLVPYLVSGQNTLQFRVIVGGVGEGWVRIKSAMCGNSLNLGTVTPPVPPSAGEPGVTDNIQDLAGGGI